MAYGNGNLCYESEKFKSMCEVLSWEDMWLTVMAMSEGNNFDYNLPLRMLFNAALGHCNTGRLFAHTTQIRVELKVSGTLEGNGNVHANFIGNDLIADLKRIEKKRNIDLLNSIYYYTIQHESNSEVFSVKIFFFDTTNLHEDATEHSRSNYQTVRMADLFLHHFKQGEIVLTNTYYQSVLVLRKAGHCDNSACSSIHDGVYYPTATPDKCCNSSITKPNILFVAVLMVLCIVGMFPMF